MKYNAFLLGLLLFTLGSCKNGSNSQEPNTFYETELFKDVQLAALYKDSKTFVDLVPKENFITLEQKYLTEKDLDGFDLQSFVNENFEDRSMASLKFETDTTKTMYEHIEIMWDKLKRGPDTRIENSSRIPLPNEYVVPGGRFQEIYYWDSYFTIEGLLASDRWDLAKSMVDNFSFLIDSIGFIPNGTRDYFETRSQPPFFSLMVNALSEERENMPLYYVEQLTKEYAFFMESKLITENFSADNHLVRMDDNGQWLNRYFDKEYTPRPEAYKEDLHLAQELRSSSDQEQLYNDLRSAAESGWDFSSRWFTGKDFSSTQTTNIVPVDLNCLLFNLEMTLSKAAELKGDRHLAERFRDRFRKRRRLMNTYLWNEEAGFYMDYNFVTYKPTGHLTLAGAFPLFFKLANRDQAEKIKDVLMEQFLKDGGLVTTLNHSGQQWDAPNGWAPLQWMAVKGLLIYGYEDEAIQIMERWLALNEKVFKNTGKMMEKYNVEDLTLLSGGGEYETQDGFGWTNGVAVGFKKILEDLKSKEN